MNKTRVEKFKEYREEIENMSFDSDIPLKKEEEERIKQNTLSHTTQDIMGKYDEYTVLIDNAEVSERKFLEEQRRKKEKIAKVRFISICVLLSMIILAIIIGIIVVALGGK